MNSSGIWDFMTGKLKFKLANAALGAIVTHALVNNIGTYIVAAESGTINNKFKNNYRILSSNYMIKRVKYHYVEGFWSRRHIHAVYGY